MATVSMESQARRTQVLRTLHGKTHEAIDDGMRAFLSEQHVFFVATAPLARDEYLNVSPKGLDTFRVLGPRSVAYLDLTGSGVETIAHLKENGRIVLMFCGFAGPPKIVRVHGRGSVDRGRTPRVRGARRPLPDAPGSARVVHVDVGRVADSCGYGVPLLAYERDRDPLDEWTDRRGPEGLAAYRQEKNHRSLDGLPGLRPPGRDRQT